MQRQKQGPDGREWMATGLRLPPGGGRALEETGALKGRGRLTPGPPTHTHTLLLLLDPASGQDGVEECPRPGVDQTQATPGML